MEIKKLTINLEGTFFSKNLIFLFKKLKEEKGITKKHFFETLKLDRSTEVRWHQNKRILDKTLKNVINYFNVQLSLNIDEEAFLNKDLTKIPNIINEPIIEYLSMDEKRLIKLFRRINSTARRSLIIFLEELVGEDHG